MEYLTTKQILEKYPFTKGQLASFLLHRHKNGLENAVGKIGKRLYFNHKKFEDWIEAKISMNKGGIAPPES